MFRDWLLGVWVPFAAAVALGAATVVLGIAGTAAPVANLGALAAALGSAACYRRARRTARRLPYRRAGVERNEDGTVGTPGPEADRSLGGGVEHDPFDDDPESFAFDGPFWTGDGDGDGVDRDAGRRRIATSDPRAREAADVLGVDPAADRATLRRAYRERVKETHPDGGGDREAFKRVRWAYEYLRERAPERPPERAHGRRR